MSDVMSRIGDGHLQLAVYLSYRVGSVKHFTSRRTRGITVEHALSGRLISFETDSQSQLDAIQTCSNLNQYVMEWTRAAN
jgi:hypothetical protein